MNEQHRTLRPCNKDRPNHCLNGHVGVNGKGFKRRANKFTRHLDIASGGAYKKVYGWFEWY